MAKCFALMGWSLPVIESMQKLNKPYVVVSFPDFEEYAKENDFCGLVEDGEFLTGLCEGCGIVTVDHEGKKIQWDKEKLSSEN